MPIQEAPCVELGSAPATPSLGPSPSPSEVSSASSPEPQNIRPTPLFRALALRPPEPDQPLGQDILERRLPGYRRIVIPRDLTLIELLKQDSGVTTDEEVLLLKEAKLKVVADRVGLRRLHVLAPRLRSLTLDGSALSSLRDLGIGLVHLKVLSVNRCGLTSLDGVWGLGVLRELHAAGNRVKDLHPVAALQKLHTLNMSNNPIEDAGRLWTLGICSSLRNLTLLETPASNEPNYRSKVATALPMLVYLDDRPMHNDVAYDTMEDIFGPASCSSDSGESETHDAEVEASEVQELLPTQLTPGTSSNPVNTECCDDLSQQVLRQRPATTEGAGTRPNRPDFPPRPRTAVTKRVEMPSKLHLMNTLMDEEWRCSGSKLTSSGPVCGNLARALRRPSTASGIRRQTGSASDDVLEEVVGEAAKTLAAEIPNAPNLEDWAKFTQETGIEIELDFETRPRGVDAMTAIERLEQIESETRARLDEEVRTHYDQVGCSSAASTFSSIPFPPDFEFNEDGVTYPALEVDNATLSNDLNINPRRRNRSSSDLNN